VDWNIEITREGIRMSIHFKIITPVYEAEDFIENALNSVFNQDYDNFEYIITDDGSKDGTVDKIKEFIEKNECGEYFNLIENDENVGALHNLYNMIQTIDSQDDDVIITLDGDDWLANDYVLKKLNEIYEKEDCWLTYGSYVQYPDGHDSSFHVSAYSEKTIKNGDFRKDPAWRASHLRTFKYNLAKRLNEEDLTDEDGSFYEMAWDFALMFPMMEMARERIFFVKDILCVYNEDNPINDHKIDRKHQIDTGERIKTRHKKKEALVV
jgi:glycosyltransferase involved in cell wall biosynthesis